MWEPKLPKNKRFFFYDTTVRPRWRSSIEKSIGYLTCVGPDGLMWAGPEKAVWPPHLQKRSNKIKRNEGGMIKFLLTE